MKKKMHQFELTSQLYWNLVKFLFNHRKTKKNESNLGPITTNLNITIIPLE